MKLIFMETLICSRLSFFALSASFFFSLNAFFFHFLPSFNLKTSASVKEEKQISATLPTVVSSSRLPFHFFWSTRRAWSHQKPSDGFSSALWLISIAKKTPSKAHPTPPFRVWGDTVMPDYVVFFRCAFYNSSVVQWSRARDVYVPVRRTHSLLSG